MNILNHQHPLQLQSLSLKNGVFLAPLAGVSDVPFRRICQEMGAGLTYVEMISSTALCHGSVRTFKMMERHHSEEILGVQITGNCAEQIAQAVRILQGLNFDTIDINMGCPVRKVVNSGCGAALIKDQMVLRNILTRVREQSDKPLSAKFRIGYDTQSINVHETAHTVASCGFDMLTIHGRTRNQRYDVPSSTHYTLQGFLAAKARNPRISTVANGDILSLNDASRISGATGACGLMVSRGALGNPWIFQDILKNQTHHISLEQWSEVVLRHLMYQRDYYGDTKTAAILFRKHIIWYSKGFPHVRRLRETLGSLDSILEIEKTIVSFVQENNRTTLRCLRPEHLCEYKSIESENNQ